MAIMPPAFFIGDTPTGFIGYHRGTTFLIDLFTNQNSRLCFLFLLDTVVLNRVLNYSPEGDNKIACM